MMTKAKDSSSINWDDYYIYDENSPTGLRNKISKVGVAKGSVAGTLNKRSGYAFVTLDGRIYPAHRVIWELFNGCLTPEQVIDHVNGIRSDNRIENLRALEHCDNRKNVAKSRRNKSGVCGVRFRVDKNAWVAFCNGLNGEQLQRSFSCSKSDYITAKLLAIAWRNTKISELNLQGAGYTERHGKEY